MTHVGGAATEGRSLGRPSAPPLVEMRGIVKRFGAVTAVDSVDLELFPGRLHAVIGENGAGKTTLMQVLAGLVVPDAGEITMRGQPVRIRGVADAHRLGVSMVHQHFMLFPSLTVAENLTIGDEPRRGGLFDREAGRRIVADLGNRFGLSVDADARVADLPVGALQRVEILRALRRGARVLILDEPTAVLTPHEAAGLFRVLRGLADDGRCVVFVTHRLDEVLEHAEDVTVLRDGRVTARLEARGTNARDLARAMVGRDVMLAIDREPVSSGRSVLELHDMHAPGLAGIDLDVRAGEIVGVAAVAGNGETELAEVIAGLQPVTRGNVVVDGRDVTRASVAERRAAGLSYIPDDRFRRGLAGDASIRDNLVVGRHNGKDGRRRLLDRAGMARRVERLVVSFRVPARDLDAPVRTLSGGNAQRVVVARELADPHPLIVASQPTRGIDVAATEFVRGALLDRRATGSGVLLISADLDEIRALSDRIVVLHRGRIVGTMPGGEADEVQLGLLMAGVTTGRSAKGVAGKVAAAEAPSGSG